MKKINVTICLQQLWTMPMVLKIPSLLVNKYDTLYSSAHTHEDEINQLHSINNEGRMSQHLQDMAVTPAVIS